MLRYVEPVDDVQLEQYLDKNVMVRHDTGDILLATQLALPKGQRKSQVRLAQNEEPIPAGKDAGESSILTQPDDTAHFDDGTIYEGFVDGEYIDGEYIDEGYIDGGYIDGGYAGDGYVIDEGYPGEGIDFGGCATCGSPVCGSPVCGSAVCRRGGPGPCGNRGRAYLRGEYLIWWFKGMDLPALAIQSDNNDFDPAEVVFGDERRLDGSRSGGRVIFGIWLGCNNQVGLEFDYFGFGEDGTRFVGGVADGLGAADNIYIGRPFFNTLEFDRDPGPGEDIVPRGRSREDVDTDDIDGTVTINVRSEFNSLGFGFRHNLCCLGQCDPCCGDGVCCGGGIGCGSCVGCGSGCGVSPACPPGPLGRLSNLIRLGTRRVDFVGGFRWAGLEEGVFILEDLQEIGGQETTFIVSDNFATQNDFFGGEFGYLVEWQRRRWTLEFLSKLAIGNTRQRVAINGYTIPDGQDPPDVGGLLAQRVEFSNNGTQLVAGNIGAYERNEFSVIPQVGLTLGYFVTPRLRLTTGYSLFYWSNVVRPGDQIDLDVNGTFIPSLNVTPQPVVDDHPRFAFRQNDLWAHGFNFGGELRW